MSENTISSFVSIGLSEQKAKETAKNKTISKNLEDVIVEVLFC